MSGESAERSDADGQTVEDEAGPAPDANEAWPPSEVRAADEDVEVQRESAGSAPDGVGAARIDRPGVQEPPRPPNEVTSRRDARPLTGEPSPVDAPPASEPSGSAIQTFTPGTNQDWTAGVIADGDPQVGDDLLPDHSFALCLTHDVDRPYKLAQAFFYALRDRDPTQLASLLPGRQPNWTFDTILQIEARHDVRSAFYFLDEQRLFRDRPMREWLDLDAWRLYADRYDLDDPAIVELLHRLDRGGWEVGLHGSYESYDDRERLRAEKERLERVLGTPIRGGRQHYLNRTLPETWEHHAAIGQDYDATIGSASEIGFGYGDTIGRPFDDSFVAFPLTMMDVAMPDPGTDPAAAWSAADRVLEAAAERGAITTVLWHPRVFNESDWPGHTDLYRHLIERAQSLGGWVGSPAELYDELDHPA
ncbi:hypothetical protein L593_11305 [Salinarchaeum sp. Harcht-Bsk1]|uniref:polysaccharide deacetylase family protein n=1 Tax=Salinarchaeum sp. Harcht-Bsk1 TaxID=1333523 RepID=UPI0003423C25|nr:polysaccharide deacetylase family protein [Salinarchaeum sp. Harcht-Bsk1]AGN02206.1 hypothetical protein L593_11305 [Salinarchaeum sp. Harcht-Bsk1]